MPRAKHLVTPVFGWEYPELGAEANVPTDLKELLTQIENIVKDLEVQFLKTAGAGDSGRLLIVQGTGDPAWKQAIGDVENNKEGTFTIRPEVVTAAKILAATITEAKLAGESIGTAKIVNLAVTAAKLAAEAVETAKIKNLAVTEAKLAELAVATAKIANAAVTAEKLADKAVTSRKLKPTRGVINANATLALTEAYQTVPGMELNITPEVESKLLIIMQIGMIELAGSAWGTIKVDAEAENTELCEVGKETQWKGHQIYYVTLTAAAHTILMRAKRGITAGCKTGGAGECKMFYELMAA